MTDHNADAGKKVEQIGIPRTHPDFVKARRERFCKLLREAKRILKLSDEEKFAVNEVLRVMERRK